jgi:precorrin isomerase
VPPHITEGLPNTTERRAIDALAVGDAPTALALYSQLWREHPENPAFADAVRILSARLDAGAPIR